MCTMFKIIEDLRPIELSSISNKSHHNLSGITKMMATMQQHLIRECSLIILSTIEHVMYQVITDPPYKCVPFTKCVIEM